MVAPTLPRAALIACTTACTDAGWLSPAITRLLPEAAFRSLVSGPRNFVTSADTVGAVTPGTFRSAASARTSPSISDALMGRQWSAREPLLVGVLSTA